MTNDKEVKERFYIDLKETLENVSIIDKLVITGDSNARVGTKTKHWPGVIGTQCTCKCNSNGEHSVLRTVLLSEILF